MDKKIEVIDLQFQGKSQAIASYMLPHSSGVVLVESGPASSLKVLQAGLRQHGYTLADVTHVLLTHIHLDHAGAAGEISGYGAQVLVHPVGAPHLLDPSKLIASATRIYGDRMDSLWGKFLPVSPTRLTILADGEEFQIGHLRFLPIFTPGHAEHHACFLHQNICFSGDIGGIRIPGYQYLRLPMPPPELNLQKWRRSIELLRTQSFSQFAPTHFGFYDDVTWQLDALTATIDRTEVWMEENFSNPNSIEALKDRFQAWMDEQALSQGLSPQAVQAFALSNPVAMSVDGMARYWNKVLHPTM